MNGSRGSKKKKKKKKREIGLKNVAIVDWIKREARCIRSV